MVRKVLGWKHKPFKIPKNILNEWKKIGNKGAKLESVWSKVYRRKKQSIDKVFKNNFSKALKSEKQNSIKENKSLASRKASELILNALTKENNTLIGGSADLAGSNNTKTKHHNAIKSVDFNGDYIHYGVREHANVWNNEWTCTS